MKIAGNAVIFSTAQGLIYFEHYPDIEFTDKNSKKGIGYFTDIETGCLTQHTVKG